MPETLTNAYATEAEFREHMADAGEKLKADQVVRALNASSRGIDRFCGRRFWQDTSVVVREYRPRDETWVVVDDISTTTGLIINTGPGDGTFDTTLTSSDYKLEPVNAEADGRPWWSIAAVGTSWPVSDVGPTVQVTARFGWTAHPVDVEFACLLKAAKLFGRKDSRDGVRGFSEFGPVRISRFEDPDVVDLLENFTRITRPDV